MQDFIKAIKTRVGTSQVLRLSGTLLTFSDPQAKRAVKLEIFPQEKNKHNGR